jgi:hypothetical protein
MIKKLHIKPIDNKNLEPKEGQCDGLMCSNKKSITHCPSFGYEYIESSEKLDKAFDILFDEVYKIINLEKQNESNNKTSSNILPSLNSSPGRRGNY